MGKGVLQDGKFWAALVALVIVFFGERGDVDPAALENAVKVLMTYIGGVSLKDGLTALAEGIRHSSN